LFQTQCAGAVQIRWARQDGPCEVVTGPVCIRGFPPGLLFPMERGSEYGKGETYITCANYRLKFYKHLFISTMCHSCPTNFILRHLHHHHHMALQSNSGFVLETRLHSFVLETRLHTFVLETRLQSKMWNLKLKLKAIKCLGPVLRTWSRNWTSGGLRNWKQVIFLTFIIHWWWSNENEKRLNIIKGFMLYIVLIKNIMILARIWIETLTHCVWKVVWTIKIILKASRILCYSRWWDEIMSLNCGLQRAYYSSPWLYIVWAWSHVEWYWQGKDEEFGEKPVPVPLRLPQIPHGLTQAWTRSSAVRGRRLTVWDTERPSKLHINIVKESVLCIPQSGQMPRKYRQSNQNVGLDTS
jgi:hypothetical protein